jgi:hypothetical protein
MKRQFKGFHLQINARSEKDVDPDIIKKKLRGNYGEAVIPSTSPNLTVLSPPNISSIEIKKSPSASSNVSGRPPIAPIPPAAPMLSGVSQRAFLEVPERLKPSAASGRSAELIDMFEGRKQDTKAFSIVSGSKTTTATFHPTAEVPNALGIHQKGMQLGFLRDLWELRRSISSYCVGSYEHPVNIRYEQETKAFVSDRDARMIELEEIRKISIGGSFTKVIIHIREDRDEIMDDSLLILGPMIII